MRALRNFVIAGLMATAGWTFAHAAERVDLLLVLAADVSGSMDDSKFEFQQRSGYAAAFSNPRVIEAIRAGPSGRIAVALIEWSGVLQQKMVIDWTVISNDETARQLGDRIMEAPRSFARSSTSISAGIDFAITRLDRAPYEARRRVIDISGDGDNNSGRDITTARDEAIAKGVTINGLVILTEPPPPSHSNHTNPLQESQARRNPSRMSPKTCPATRRYQGFPTGSGRHAQCMVFKEYGCGGCMDTRRIWHVARGETVSGSGTPHAILGDSGEAGDGKPVSPSVAGCRMHDGAERSRDPVGKKHGGNEAQETPPVHFSSGPRALALI
jgi:Protein of unknown function (DUF1194)